MKAMQALANKPLEEMSKKEKKTFLSMDMIERMIRVEQKVSASFHNYVSYNETEYYKSLNPSEKAKFESYLRAKKIKKSMIAASLALILPALAFFGFSFTGKAIEEGGVGSVPNSTIILLIVFLGLLLVISAIVLAARKNDKKLEGHISVIDNIVVNRH